MERTSRDPGASAPEALVHAAGEPSSWRERGRVLALALAACCIAAYLASYQLHWVADAWDPVFGRGTELVLTSRFSELFPVPDAALGLGGYLSEVVLVSLGGTRRWRTSPWLVLLYGLVTLGMGGVGLGLAFTMSVAVGHWCFLCLCNTLLSVTVLFLSWPEILAAASGVRARIAAGASPVRALLGAAGREGRPAPHAT